MFSTILIDYFDANKYSILKSKSQKTCKYCAKNIDENSEPVVVCSTNVDDNIVLSGDNDASTVASVTKF